LEIKMEKVEEPSLAAEAVAGNEPAPAKPSDEPDGQLPPAEAPALATTDEEKGPGMSAKFAVSTSLAPPPALDEDLLLVSQLANSVSINITNDEENQWKLRDGAVALYRGLEPRDAIESILARLAVAVTNSTMDCFYRAAQCDQALPARDLNLRHGMKGAVAAADLLKVLNSRRSQGLKNVTVGKVNVEAGGQAIVGNIETGERRKATKPQSVPAFPSTEDED
jgi:hypothetical protein